MIRPPLLDLNFVELKYHPFIIRLDKCAGSCNVLSPKIWVPKETKDAYVKVCNMITNKMKLKPWQNIFHVILNANSIVQHVTRKKIILGLLGHLFVKTASIEKVMLIL